MTSIPLGTQVSTASNTPGNNLLFSPHDTSLTKQSASSYWTCHQDLKFHNSRRKVNKVVSGILTQQ